MQMRGLILEGKIIAGERIPSTRELAAALGVSRNVILEVYSLLTAEGYIEGRLGSGTKVAEGACLGRTGGIPSPPVIAPATMLIEQPKDLIDFRSGVPALDVFPIKQWGKSIHEICLESPGSMLMYDAPEGSWELRNALSEYLFRARGINCRPEQLLITSGATQGLALVAKLLYLPGAEIVVEDPLNIGMRSIFITAGYRLRPVPVDAQGLQTQLLPPGMSPRLIYVTPSHQFPLGGILPVQRRIELIAFARKNDCYIVEDDYDSEFRYEGPPLSALQWLAPERVIYVGSFSKILAPALRLGYVILPAPLMQRCRELKRFSDVHTPSLEQLALARFIKEGKLERHVTRMKRVYASRRRIIKEALMHHFPGEYIITGDSTGLHLIAEFPEIEFSDEVLRMLKQNGVREAL